MGRPIYNHELCDPDFSWLISSFKENNPNFAFIDSSGIPVVFIASHTLEIKECSESTADEFPVEDKAAALKDEKEPTVP